MKHETPLVQIRPLNMAATAMPRRDFLKTSAAVAVLSCSARAFGQTAKPRASSSSVLDACAGEHAQRLRYLAECEHRIRQCLRKRSVFDYLPGQVFYNLGEYPCRKPWDPDDWDEEQLQEYSRAGVELVQVHMEWADPQRLFGADMLSPLNEKGFRRFVDMCHRHGLKIIPYISTGYFPSTDPNFRPEWANSKAVESYYSLARCLPDSPGWRAYLLPRLKRILDQYGVDGFYNDVGYARDTKSRRSEDEGIGAKSVPKSDAAFEDLLGIVYDEVKRRGGVIKVHAGLWYRGTQKPPIDPKLYDYLWVGETGEGPDKQRETVKDHPPYLVPCLDLARTPVANEDELYLHALPYLQFPVLLAGRPFTGERMFIPGIRYRPEPANPKVWTRSRHLRKIWEFYQKNPKGPFSYAEWDSCPGRPEARPTFYRWLKLYRAMVEPGTSAYLEVTDSDLFAVPPSAQVTASVFANRNLYLALANYSVRDATIETKDLYRSCTDETAAPQKSWQLKARSLIVIKRLCESAGSIGG
jgi:hypothetical protein